MTTSRTYDGFNRLTGISSAPAGASAVSFNYGYNPANQRSTVTNADNSWWDYQYDYLGQLTNAVRRWSDGSPVAGQQFEYGFDTIGNRRTHSWGGDTNGANLRQTSYSVNLLNQITGRNNPGYVTITGEADTNAAVKVNGTATSRHGRYFAGEAPANNASPVWLGITNVAVAATNGSSETYTKEVGHVFVPPASQTFSTIHEGCLYADGRWYYRWDAENRLVKMTAASPYVGYPYQELRFTHDWQSRRISKVVSNKVSGVWYLETSRKFLYDGWNLVAELDGSNVLQRTHIWGIDASGSMQGAGGVGGLLATIIHTGTNAGVYFPAYDGNHNVVAYISAATGAIVAEYDYGPFGELLRATGPLAKEFTFLFSTKYYDWETGLYYYGYRYYNPSTGRWLSRDPIGETDCPHVYCFLRNNPPHAFDPRGLLTIEYISDGFQYHAPPHEAFYLGLSGRLDEGDYERWGMSRKREPFVIIVRTSTHVFLQSCDNSKSFSDAGERYYFHAFDKYATTAVFPNEVLGGAQSLWLFDDMSMRFDFNPIAFSTEELLGKGLGGKGSRGHISVNLQFQLMPAAWLQNDPLARWQPLSRGTLPFGHRIFYPDSAHVPYTTYQPTAWSASTYAAEFSMTFEWDSCCIPFCNYEASRDVAVGPQRSGRMSAPSAQFFR